MKASEFQVRRVIHGTMSNGLSGVLSDETVPHRVVTPGFTLVDVWRFDGLPVPVDPVDRIEEISLTPAPGQAVLRLAAIPPDEEWSGLDYSESLQAAGHDDQGHGEGGNGGEGGSAADGYHATDTVDGVIVLSGEVHCLTDTAETHLRTGDVVMQVGNNHKWSNRSGDVCVVAFVMASGTRP